MRLRYLTEHEKRRCMRELAQELEAKRIDPELIPWLAKINKVKGVCTTQCCAGHELRGLATGYISLRMVGRLHRQLEACLGRLSRKVWFEDARTAYDYTCAGDVKPRLVLWFWADQREQALADILAEVQELSARRRAHDQAR